MDVGLRRWVEDVTGAPVAAAERSFTGGSRQLWFLDSGDEQLVLRVDDGVSALSGTDLSLEREAVVYRALHGAAVPVPEVLALGQGGHALLLRRVPGSSDLRRLPEAEVDAVLESFMAALGALHSVDVGQLDLPGFARPADAQDHARCELARWADLAARLACPIPMVELGLAWLRTNAPASVQRTVLVQGDTGPGNFVAEAGVVTGIVDWELSHIGDPMDDIAWLDLRASTAGFGSTAQRDRLYEKASGLLVDEAAVRYYTAFVYLRCAIITALTIDRGGGALGLVAYRAPHHRFLLGLGQALADAIGVAVTPVQLPEVDEDVGVELHDHALAALRDGVLPSLADPAAKLQARAAVLALEHLRARELLGSVLEEQERRDQHATFGRAVSDADLIGGSPDPGVLDYLVRRAQRELACWATPAVGGWMGLQPLPRSAVSSRS